MKDFESIQSVCEKYKFYFPIGVYGTLRKIPQDQGNLWRMLVKTPIAHKKAFIPHVVPNNIWLNFQENASGMFEVFFYNKEDFPEVISCVDKLEGFKWNQCAYGYYRTLVNARILPDDYADYMYSKGIRLNNRDLKIPVKEWESFEKVPVWIYSNQATNKKLKSVENSPLLWYGEI